MHNNTYEKRKEGYRIPKLGYYCILVDTKETEVNYIKSLKDRIDSKFNGKIVIKVKKDIPTKDLVEEAKLFSRNSSQFSIPYIVFDKDKVEKFDEIIDNAKNNNIETAWSNPCFEVWLLAYFGESYNYTESMKCCERMNKVFKEKTGFEYDKSSKDLYNKLMKYGDEKKAIRISNEKYVSMSRNAEKPSEMIGCNTVFILIDEITKKLNAK